MVDRSVTGKTGQPIRRSGKAALNSRGNAGRPPATNGMDTAKRIFEAATRLFYLKGFEATTIREIADACDVTAGAIYNHFPAKQAILYAIIKWAHDELDRDLAAALKACDPDPRQQLQVAMTTFVLRHTQYPQAARIANRDYVFLAKPERRMIVLRRRKTRLLFEDMLREGSERGLMAYPKASPHPRDASVQREIVAMAIINMGIMVAEWYRPDGPLSAAQIADMHGRFGLQLVAVPATTRS